MAAPNTRQPGGPPLTPDEIRELLALETEHLGDDVVAARLRDEVGRIRIEAALRKARRVAAVRACLALLGIQAVCAVCLALIAVGSDPRETFIGVFRPMMVFWVGLDAFIVAVVLIGRWGRLGRWLKE